MGIKYAGTIERMLEAGRLKNVSAVARIAGVTPQAFANYKKKGEIPSDLVIKFANIFGLSVNWLMTGEGEMRLCAVNGSMDGEGLIEEFLKKEPVISVMLSTLGSDELIYVGKLLKLLRSADGSVSATVKKTIDAFL